MSKNLSYHGALQDIIMVVLKNVLIWVLYTNLKLSRVSIFVELVIEGSACKRLMSGSQKSAYEEEQILATLREEGLITKQTNKAHHGMR